MNNEELWENNDAGKRSTGCFLGTRRRSKKCVLLNLVQTFDNQEILTIKSFKESTHWYWKSSIYVIIIHPLIAAVSSRRSSSSLFHVIEFSFNYFLHLHLPPTYFFICCRVFQVKQFERHDSLMGYCPWLTRTRILSSSIKIHWIMISCAE